jgi:hypothetical protein
MWIFTLGEPSDELMGMVHDLTASPLGLLWVLIPVPEAEGLTSLRDGPISIGVGEGLLDGG